MTITRRKDPQGSQRRRALQARGRNMIKKPTKSKEQAQGEQAIIQFMKAADPVREWIRRKGTRSLRQLYQLMMNPKETVTPEKVFALFLGETIAFPSEQDLNDAVYREALSRLKGKYRLTLADIAEAFGIDPSRRYDVETLEKRWQAKQGRREFIPRVGLTEEEQAVGDELLRHFRQGHWAWRKKRLTEDFLRRLRRHF
jgi:hypothetical protein